MNEYIRDLFPITGEYTYLNCAAVAPLPAPSVEAVAAQLLDVSENGSVGYANWVETKNRARKLIAAMLGVRDDQIAFLRNTSDGFSTVANGLNWKKGDNIVTFAKEFPSNFYAWRRIRDKFGVELRLCPERGARVDPDEFIGLIDSNTRLVSVSAVQFASGFRSDLERIGRAARLVDALFAVDIIQGLGALPFDLPAQFVDVAAGASHKWLCSPEGCGILYLSDRALERIEPTLVGWISVEDMWDFEDLEQAFKSSALAWETGTGCSALFYGLEQSVRILSGVGAPKIQEYLEELTDYLCEILSKLYYEVVSSRKPGEKSQIVSIRNRAGLAASAVSKQLEAKRIIISPRNDCIRVAPHFFNNFNDIERLVENLP